MPLTELTPKSRALAVMQSFWEFLRRAACDAVLAGVEDAVRLLEQGKSLGDDSRSAGQLADRLTRVIAKRIEGPPRASEEKTPAVTTKQAPAPAPSATEKVAPPSRDLFDSQTEPPPSPTMSPAGHLRTGEKIYFPRGRRGRRAKDNRRSQ